MTQHQAKDFSSGAAFVNGTFVPITEAQISILDWGFTRSDVTYDVVHVWNGGFFRLDDHLDRFERSLGQMRLAPPNTRDEMKVILDRCVSLANLRESYVAMISTRGRPKIYGSRRPADCANTFMAYAVPWIDIVPKAVQERGAHIRLASKQRISPDAIDPTVKNYHWGDFTQGLLEAHDEDFDTTLLLDHEGYVTEGPGFNIFIIRDGKVFTPDRGVLEGITRRSALELCALKNIKAEIAPLRYEDLMTADEAFCTSTAGGLVPVSKINGHIMSNGSPGPISIALKDFYWEQHRAGWHVTPVNYDQKAESL
ncbi:MAG: aminotransferase class IV [Alphaproteobacteria bacterium]